MLMACLHRGRGQVFFFAAGASEGEVEKHANLWAPVGRQKVSISSTRKARLDAQVA